MPWRPEDATKHTKLAKSSKLRRMWRDVANGELNEHGDEGRAVRAANAVVHREAAKGVKHKPRKR
jgi:hypothetical protein